MENLSLKRLSAVGVWGGPICWGTQKIYYGFFKPEDIKSISLGAIWKFGKVTGHPGIEMGHKGPVN
jgi:hypothetical protein